MPVILVLIVAVVWVGILASNVVKRRVHRGDGITSISHFHRQLAVLEHSAPDPIVAPAYRLRSVDGAGTMSSRPLGGEGEAPVLTVVGADKLPKPALAFLGRDAAVPPVEAPDAFTSHPACPVSDGLHSLLRADSPARLQVRRRRRDTMGVLSAVVAVTFLLGFLPGAGLAWMVCGLAGAALAGYVALLVRLRRVAEERTRKLRYLRDGVAVTGSETAWRPGSAGRFAHPAYQMSAAR